MEKMGLRVSEGKTEEKNEENQGRRIKGKRWNLRISKNMKYEYNEKIKKSLT